MNGLSIHVPFLGKPHMKGLHCPLLVVHLALQNHRRYRRLHCFLLVSVSLVHYHLPKALNLVEIVLD
jgi:hypothetical protein